MSSTIKELQSEFTKSFPYLKIEFYKKPHAEGELNTLFQKINPTDKIDDYSIKRRSGELSFSKTDTVATVEKVFHDVFGLNVQVFRRSGNAWIGTSVTDGWTLAQQNDEAKVSVDYKNNQSPILTSDIDDEFLGRDKS
jgi:hypothetical protein